MSRRVLHLCLEFTAWRQARSWPYASELALDEGLRANGARPVTVTTPWLPRLREVCGGRRFDQVWVEVVHQAVLDDDVLTWIAERAPVRIGFAPETLAYDEEVYAIWPHYRTRKQEVKHRLKFLTHALVVDETEAAELAAEGNVRAGWWLPSVPRRFIADDPASGSGPAIFTGTIYGTRGRLLNDPAIQGLMAAGPSPESGTPYPRLFERLHIIATGWVERRLPAPRSALTIYLTVLRRLRKQIFHRWLQSLRKASVVVSLPHLVGAYPGRVVEAMAAGRPVVSWDVPGRPRNRALFEADREIVYFAGTDSAALASAIRRLQSDPGLAGTIAANASRKVGRFHTTEHRVGQILKWTDTGDDAVFAS